MQVSLFLTIMDFMKANLPENFKNEMQSLLGSEYEAYLSSFEEEGYTAVRVNTLKISVGEFLKIVPFSLTPVPWCKDAFYIENKEEVSKHPFYHAGLYYIQEPSAALPAEILPIEEGDKVLDLCAAPGGKSTKLAAKLHHTGVLIANDISSSRCQSLIKNLESFGTKNFYVTSETPERLNDVFTEYFDKILVDAPCSGSGMFRKEKHLIRSYEERGSGYYVPIQKEIVKNALGMLKEGGQLVYSTCTFSKAEDEEIIQYALSLDETLKVEMIPQYAGFVSNEYGTKLFPHRIKGEGHFVSLLTKGEKAVSKVQAEKEETWNWETVHLKHQGMELQEIQERLYLAPKMERDMRGLRIMRSGLMLGETKKGRFEPSGALGLALQKEECDIVLDFDAKDERVRRYLRGETIDISDFSAKDGYALITVQSHPLGFVKITKGICKNKYPKGRIQR